MKINLSQFKRFEKQIILKKIGLSGQKKIFSANRPETIVPTGTSIRETSSHEIKNCNIPKI